MKTYSGIWKESLIAVYLDWVNNYLTLQHFADDYELTLQQARQIIDIGRDLNNKAAPND